MSKSIFRAVPGSHVSNKKAQLLGPVIQQLRNEKRLGRDGLVSEARAKSSPIHDLFDWDNNSAAEKYRLEQAGKYLAAVEIVVAQGKVRAPIRFAYAIRGEKDAMEWVTVEDIRGDRDLARRIQNEMWEDALDLVEKYERYSRIFRIQMSPFRRVVAAIKQIDKKKVAA